VTLSKFAQRVLSTPVVTRTFPMVSTCLMYHRLVAARIDGEFAPNSGLAVAVDEFEQQMRFLSENSDVISIPDAVERLTNGTFRRPAVTVTFDDGYEDNLTLALPILQKYRIPATIYITTAGPERRRYLWWFELESIMRRLPSGSLAIGGQEFRWHDARGKHRAFMELNEVMKRSTPAAQNALLEQARGWLREQDAEEPVPSMLSWDQIRTLDANPLITIGCHTSNHYSMTQLSAEDLALDLRASKAKLESELGHVVDHFAYPYGRRPEASLREFGAVREAGFLSAVTTRFAHWMPSHRDHVYELPRIAITHQDTLHTFRTKATGVRSLLMNRGWPVITD
jgi:peptidoglycan/xylan/chitin deacetylase (PgdA/CDA1 family)